jgi:hypothetical protein
MLINTVIRSYTIKNCIRRSMPDKCSTHVNHFILHIISVLGLALHMSWHYNTAGYS